MPGWGTSAWGTTTWGTGAAAPGFWISDAWAVKTRVVRVVFSSPPQALYASYVGDALNPDSWTIQLFVAATALTVVKAEKVNDITFDVYTKEDFSGHLVVHEVDATGVRNSAKVYIVAPRSWQFPGALYDATATDKATLASRRGTARDFENPLFDGENIGGALRVTSGGDYALHEGEAMVRKLIYRRLITSPGELKHAPDYGIGLKVKEPIPAGDLVKLKANIVEQVGREPEVDRVQVTLAQTVNILTISMKVKLKQTGNESDLNYEFPFEGVTL